MQDNFNQISVKKQYRKVTNTKVCPTLYKPLLFTKQGIEALFSVEGPWLLPLKHPYKRIFKENKTIASHGRFKSTEF